MVGNLLASFLLKASFVQNFTCEFSNYHDWQPILADITKIWVSKLKTVTVLIPFNLKAKTQKLSVCLTREL